MKLKTNLHFHTSEDPRHPTISYDIKGGIDHAVEKGFGALAITCHTKVLATEEHIRYAKEKGLLLISGIEADIRRTKNGIARHVVILNCQKDIEDVITFAELEEYKKNHPEIFILAPHPYHYGAAPSLHRDFLPNLHLFDAIEHSWFYSHFFNRNERAEKVATENKIPFVSTSDTHYFDYFDEYYTVVDAEEATPTGLFHALREGKFENVHHPQSAIRMFVRFFNFTVRDVKRRWHGNIKKKLSPAKK